jgi:hypothetical protein
MTDPETIEALKARVRGLEEALREIASEEFKGPGGISIYAAAANELPRLKKIARDALTPPENHHD